MKAKGKRQKSKVIRQNINSESGKYIYRRFFSILKFCLLPFAFCLLQSCTSAPKDLRRFAPAETLIWLESNNLAQTINSVTENETFKKITTEKTDFSALEGVQVAVAVTEFETSEKQITDSQSILNFKPKFALIAETHAWSWQTNSLVENNLDDFIRKQYGADAKLEKSPKDTGILYKWTSDDNRQSFAFVEGSLVFFGNNIDSIEKCLAAKNGAAENLVKNESLDSKRESAKNSLAFGYISGDGIKQIADLIGVKQAIETSEEEAPRSFISKILPEILRGTIKEISWTANKNEKRIEDKFFIETTPEISTVLKETIVPNTKNGQTLAEFLPAEIFSATRYNLENPQIAWRSLLITAAKQLDETSAKILLAFSDSFFVSYGVSNGENFLSNIGSEIWTARFDAEGGKSAAIVKIKDAEKLKKSLVEDFDFKTAGEKNGEAKIFKAKTENLTAAFVGEILIIGDSENVIKCLNAKASGQNFAKTGKFAEISDSNAVAVTFSNDIDSAKNTAKVLGNLKNGNEQIFSTFTTETRFIGRGFERKTVSDFGFIGTILEQF